MHALARTAGPFQIRKVVRIRMPYTVRAETFHNPAVSAPVHRPVTHMMIRRIMYAAEFPRAFTLGMGCKPALAYLYPENRLRNMHPDPVQTHSL